MLEHAIPEGYSFAEGAVYKGDELLIDFSSDRFRCVQFDNCATVGIDISISIISSTTADSTHILGSVIEFTSPIYFDEFAVNIFRVSNFLTSISAST